MNKTRELIILEITGKERFRIEKIDKLPDDERIIHLIDRKRIDDDGIPETLQFLQSDIPLIQDASIRSFLFRHLRLIHSGFYDE